MKSSVLLFAKSTYATLRRSIYPAGVALGFGLLLCSAAAAETRTLDARWLFTHAVTRDLCLSENGKHLQLARGEVFEDDGPAAGYTYGPSIERISGEIQARKELIIPPPAGKQATLLLAPGGKLHIRVNGALLEAGEPAKSGHYWQAYDLPPELLRDGKNEFVFSGNGQLWIAREEHYRLGSLSRTKSPNRSAKRLGPDEPWNDKQLGTKNDLDGEYYVRVFLDHYVPQGEMMLPVVDAGNLSEAKIPPSVGKPGPVRIRLNAETAEGRTVRCDARTGSTFVPRDSAWTAWQPLELDSRGSATLDSLGGRYLQLRLRLATADPLTTPRLRQISLATRSPETRSWTKRLQVAGSKNRPVGRSSIPFRYEPFDDPALAELRRNYRLDEVVEGAETELELLSKLAVWSSQRWPKLGHLGEGYPPWDALAILKPHRDGTPVGGFCLQYNLVFLQACESFGIAGRIVSIGPGNETGRIRGGHETVEVWSNQFEKWIYFDGNTAWYFVDRETEVPLSLLELRERQLDAFAGRPVKPMRIVRLAETRYEWKGIESWPPLVELRLVPRSNFLEQLRPLPLHQGMRGWFWTGHYVWNDRRMPARKLYPRRICRRGNWEWTLNHAHIVLEPLEEPGELRVHLDSGTPELESYQARIGDGPQEPVEATFRWSLQEGINRLTVTPRNTAGRSGIPSWVELFFSPESGD